MPITMLIGMSLEDFPATLAALNEVAHSDEPTAKKDAAKLAAVLTDKLEKLADWANDLTSTIDETRMAADELSEADSEDRPDCHASFSASADAVLDALVELGIERPAS